MKFTWKLILSVTAVIAVLFSAAGVLIINSNFKHSLEAIASQNVEAYLLERYGVENNIVDNISESGEVSREKLAEYAGSLVSYLSDNRKFAIYYENESVYSNMDIDGESLAFLSREKELGYVLKKLETGSYMFVGSSLEINHKKVVLVSRYDITAVFEEKERQLSDFYQLDAALLLFSAAVICTLTIFLTKPIVRLNEMSKKIAAGQYQERIHVRTSDEIGELTRSFNCMAETIEHKIEELELSVRQREEFISNFTHELKSPMTSIIGYADLLRSGKYSSQIKIKSAEHIFREAKRLELLSHKLMDLMGLSAESIQIEKLDIVQYIDNIKGDIQDNPGDTELVTDLEQGTVKADPCLLEACIRNLIENAKKAGPRDQRVVLQGRCRQKRYQISVIDKGCGISEEDLPRITESFYMADKARTGTGSGSGIGLAVCEKIVCFHGGRLEFESRLGEGTTARFDLEVEEDED